MKISGFIFVSLFVLSVNVKAQTTTSGAPAVYGKDYVDYLREKDAKTEANEGKEECEEAYEKYYDARKESVEDAKTKKDEALEKLAEKKLEKSEKISDGEEKVAEAEEASQQAEIEYKETKDALTEELNNLEEETHQQAQEKIRALQDDLSELDKNLNIDRDTVNNEYRNQIAAGYEKCKMTAEQLFATRIGMERQANRAENTGQIKSGGATLATGSAIRKAKKEAKALHAKCIAETTRVLEAKRASEIDKLKLQEKRLTQEINAKRSELKRLTEDNYTKKATAIYEKMRTAGATMVKAQEKAYKDRERLLKTISQETAILDEEILRLQAVASGQLISSSDEQALAAQSEESAKGLCCEKGEPKYGVRGVTDSFCKKRSSRSKRNKGTR